MPRVLKMLNNCSVISRMLSEGAKLIDVRTAVEWNQGHIDRAENIPLESLEYFARNEFDKETTYLLFCRSGARSQAGKEYLERLGFKAYNVGMIQTIKVCKE